MPGLHGRLFFADFCEGWVRSLAYAFGEVGFVRDHPELSVGTPISGFGVDALGEVYVLAWEDGAVYRVAPE